MVTKTYLPTYQWNSSHSSDRSDKKVCHTIDLLFFLSIKYSKLEWWQNSNSGKTKKYSNLNKTHQPTLWQNSTTQIETKLKNQIVTKLNNSNCEKTQKLKLWQNSKTHIVKNMLKNSLSWILLTLADVDKGGGGNAYTQNVDD